jgi:hypothetical protein
MPTLNQRPEEAVMPVVPALLRSPRDGRLLTTPSVED